jgi:hypothetical protein
LEGHGHVDAEDLPGRQIGLAAALGEATVVGSNRATDVTRVELPGVSCQCGLLVGRTLRLEISARNLTEAVFTKLHNRTR